MSATGFTYDAARGELKEIQTISTLPADYAKSQRDSTSEAEIDRKGKFLYVANRGHDSIAGFRIDKDSGELTSLGQTPTEKTPRSFDFDPSGKYLFAAGEGTGRLATFRVSESAGTLERIATQDVGKEPWWVIGVRLPSK